MKKLLAVVLAAMMVLSLGVMASADTTSAQPVASFQWYGADDKPLDVAGMTALGGDFAKIAPNGTILPANMKFDTETATTDLINPDSTVWIGLGTIFEYSDKGEWKVKTDKGDDNAKLISKMSVVTSAADKFASGRQEAIKIELKPDYTDNDYKFSPSVKLTYKGDEDTNKNEGVYLVVDVKFWMGNFGESADRDYDAGKGGVVLKPVKNEDNEINWEDENNTIATLKFVGDDDGKYFFPKLSTKWEDADYAEYFADQDAFIFNFVANASGKTAIASTSRATLELYNPYYNEDDDELTVDPENVVIYAVADDGSINDVTASFKAVETDDGDYVFQTKTRELGCYIIAEKPYTTAAADDVETPDDGKAIPDTGIWA